MSKNVGNMLSVRQFAFFFANIQNYSVIYSKIVKTVSSGSGLINLS